MLQVSTIRKNMKCKPFLILSKTLSITVCRWRGNKREFGCILHLDIKDGKVWIQHDGTEVGIANQLVELGVPKHDIVLAFHEPAVRQFTGFGTGEAKETSLAS